jgi:hypothetical protein
MGEGVCCWCEYLSTFADLIGFVGALFLAYPFFSSQKLRDQALAIDTSRIPDPNDAVLFAAAKQHLIGEILTAVRTEYWAARIGAVLIACAFIGRFVSALPTVFPHYFSSPV